MYPKEGEGIDPSAIEGPVDHRLALGWLGCELGGVGFEEGLKLRDRGNELFPLGTVQGHWELAHAIGATAALFGDLEPNLAGRSGFEVSDLLLRGLEHLE